MVQDGTIHASKLVGRVLQLRLLPDLRTLIGYPLKRCLKDGSCVPVNREKDLKTLTQTNSVDRVYLLS